ncbi:hypothetical protein C8R46DRAFT_996766 [Mycena filopes]|nr:hypothetical protein C8R46DRAFT_996766 [Mycena filopes]
MDRPFSLDDLVSLQNEPLPASEARLAHLWILEAEKESARVEEEIETLELRRQNLQSRRLDLQRSLQIYRRAVAPHKSLPAEILCEIFKSSGGPSNLNEITLPPSNNVPLALCGVCSRWRAVALATHELWSDVRVNFRQEIWMDAPVNPRVRRAAHLLTGLDLWLSRTGTHPVTLHIASANSLELRRSPEYVRIDELMVEYSGRFRSLSVLALPLQSTLFTIPPRVSSNWKPSTSNSHIPTAMAQPYLRSLLMLLPQSCAHSFWADRTTRLVFPSSISRGVLSPVSTSFRGWAPSRITTYCSKNANP